jgi:IS4 transposase
MRLRRKGIETGYSGVERFRATTSTNHSLRLLNFFYALILYNAWLLANMIMARRFSKIPF